MTAALMNGDCGNDDGDCSDNNSMATAMMQQSGDDATGWQQCNSVMMMAWQMRQGQHGDYSYDGMVTAAMTMQ